MKTYRSNLEKSCAELLTAQDLLFEYEQQRVVLQEGFRVEFPIYQREANSFKEYNRKITAITYTPDFIGDGWIIETKGYEKESSKIKWKMFKKYLKDKNISIVLLKPHTKKEILECIQIIKSTSKNKNITRI